MNGIKEVQSKFFNTLKNTYNFFEMYANADNIDPREYRLEYKLVRNVNNAFDEYDLNKVVKLINNFVNEDLSNWYIRRNRRRFWSPDLDNSKMGVYQTTYDVLVGLSKLIAPITPFISEEMYQKLTGNESVHLEDYPEVDENKINEVIESRMDKVRDLISLGRNAREESKIKVRQPISEILIDGNIEELIGDLVPLIEEELNVKKIIFTRELNKYMNFTVKPNFKEVGKVFGSKIGEFTKCLLELDISQINMLNNGSDIKITFDGKELNVTPNMVDIRINAKDGFDVVYENNNFVILNTLLTKDLLDEGIARELISKVQQSRKDSNFEITDRINIYYSGSSNFEEVLRKFEEFIKQETLCLEFIKDDSLIKDYELNSEVVKLDVKRIN